MEYSNKYSKTSQILWQYYRDEPALTDGGAPEYFPGDTASFTYQQKWQVKQEIMAEKLLKYWFHWNI